MNPHPPPSERSRVRRSADLAQYDPAVVRAIVDASYLCHVAFHDDAGVYCIPTACWRDEDHLVIHGSNGSRMVRLLAAGAPACVTITHLDGLVLARSAFNHSMNYRSVVIQGRFETLAAERKPAVLDLLMDHIAPGRRHEVRAGDANELAATTVLRLSLAEASVKVRTGGPSDLPEDLGIEAWVGVLPFGTVHGMPRPEGDVLREAPPYVRDWQLARPLAASPSEA